jgi:hypothetical protein
MIFSGVGILGLGLVVAVASTSLPGSQDEPWLDVAWRPGSSITTILTWVVAIAAVIGAVVLMLSVREPRMRRERERRWALFAMIVVILLFFLAWRYLRPVAEELLSEEPELLPGAEEPLPGGAAASNPIWVLGGLVALIVIVALVRLGMTLRSAKEDLSWDVAPVAAPLPTAPDSTPRLHGADPRSRVIGAYLDFEDKAGAAGIPREPAETAAVHARRVVSRLGLPPGVARVLVNGHSAARFGSEEPTVEDADRAVSAAATLCDRMPD